MSSTVDLVLSENISRSGETFASFTGPTANASSPGSCPPLVVPWDQLYYWAKDWQTGEAEALRDLAEGRSRTFDNGTDAAEWLLSDDED